MAFDWYIQQEVNVWSPEQEALYGLPSGSYLALNHPTLEVTGEKMATAIRS